MDALHRWQLRIARALGPGRTGGRIRYPWADRSRSRPSALPTIPRRRRRACATCLEATAPLRMAALSIALSLIVHCGSLQGGPVASVLHASCSSQGVATASPTSRHATARHRAAACGRNQEPREFARLRRSSKRRCGGACARSRNRAGGIPVRDYRFALAKRVVIAEVPHRISHGASQRQYRVLPLPTGRAGASQVGRVGRSGVMGAW